MPAVSSQVVDSVGLRQHQCLQSAISRLSLHVRCHCVRRVRGDGQWRRLSYVCTARLRVENPELVVGDAVAMVNFCLYKQIASIALAPDFPGWMAPVAFSWTRFSEFCGLTATLTGTWVAAGLLLGAYTTAATADLPAALRTASLTWLLAMPVAAAQLVLATAVESRALVGDVDFASAMPLAASGVGEPFVSASGVLALMTLWRCVYSLYLDPFGFKGLGFRRQQFLRELYRPLHSLKEVRSAGRTTERMAIAAAEPLTPLTPSAACPPFNSFREALLMVTLMASIGAASLQVIQALDSLISRNNI